MPSTASDPSRPQRAANIAWFVHALVIVVAIGWLMHRAMSVQPGPGQLPIPVWALVAWVAAFVLMGLAPRWPSLMLIIYATLATVVARYEPGIDVPLNTTVLGWITIAAVTGTGVWAIRGQRSPQGLRGVHWLTWVLLALVIWVACSGVAARIRDGYYDPASEHHPRVFLQALVWFLLASQFLHEPLEALLITLAICLSLVIRGRLLSPFGVWKQEDIAALIAMAVPLGFMGLWIAGAFALPMPARWRAARSAIVWLLMLLFVGMLAVLLYELWGTQNRTGAVGLAAAILVMWLASRHRLLLLAVGAPLLAVAVWFGYRLMYPPGYWKRFADIWTGGPESGSVESRLVLWKAGWRMFLDHPITGVGCGNFERFLPLYTSIQEPKPAHNNWIAMLAETGLPGALLYTVFFAGTLLALWRVIHVARREWPAPAARLLAPAICAYLAIGLTITRHDLVLAYLLAGWGVGLWGRLTGESLFRAADRERALESPSAVAKQRRA